jgi:hypothetical protein
MGTEGQNAYKGMDAQLLESRDFWRDVALCLMKGLATVFSREMGLKSCSKVRKASMKRVCQTCLDAMDGKFDRDKNLIQMGDVKEDLVFLASRMGEGGKITEGKKDDHQENG